MKPESEAWKALEQRAASQLRSDFAARVMRFSQDPAPAVWQQLRDEGASRLRPGFAERVLRAVRERVVEPAFGTQLALGGATLAICLAAVVFYHRHVTSTQEELNLASWEQFTNESQYFGLRQ